MCRGAQAHAGWPLRHAVPENSKAMPYACSMGEPLLEGLPAAQLSISVRWLLARAALHVVSAPCTRRPAASIYRS